MVFDSRMTRSRLETRKLVPFLRFCTVDRQPIAPSYCGYRLPQLIQARRYIFNYPEALRDAVFRRVGDGIRL